jgi:hypothetical protein
MRFKFWTARSDLGLEPATYNRSSCGPAGELTLALHFIEANDSFHGL